MSKSSRNYSDKTLKILSMRSGGVCAYPNCNAELIITEPDSDPIIVGEIAHIVAHSTQGPRGNPNYLSNEINHFNNLIFLCGSHHKLVDSNPQKYTSQLLLEWKKHHEETVRNTLLDRVSTITFAELEVAAKAISGMPSTPTNDFRITPLRDKMEKNRLSDEIISLITFGAASSNNVQDFINRMALIDGKYPERLKAGFVKTYRELINLGLYGDELFLILMSANKFNRFTIGEQAACVAILVYLFEKCEIFEK